jgi:pimeloyl-ACP methyl ester carboxylesterase
MQESPMWNALAGLAHTLPYDFAIVGPWQVGQPLTADDWPTATMPVLVIDGGASPAWMRDSAKQLASVLPQGSYVTLPGQDHGVVFTAPQVIAPAIGRFLAATQPGATVDYVD